MHPSKERYLKLISILLLMAILGAITAPLVTAFAAGDEDGDIGDHENQGKSNQEGNKALPDDSGELNSTK